ncbi:uncharacterized protein LOC114531300 [Dendronephthya gigantea]|uniref:uncharacterized protein LOC114531300 n=1 Tax=Dendronephthya gigantea TaxID=151771 RepID=UPI00106D89A2|nr:uncharacterized protein LOC114531300 [Dendronephthya gigantea]
MDQFITEREEVQGTQPCSCKTSLQNEMEDEIEEKDCSCKEKGLGDETRKNGASVAACKEGKSDSHIKTDDSGLREKSTEKKVSSYSGGTNMWSYNKFPQTYYFNGVRLADDVVGSVTMPKISTTRSCETSDLNKEIPDTRGPQHMSQENAIAEENDLTCNFASEALLKRVYKINKGYALIVHNRFFNNLSTRDGSEKDLDAIRSFCEEANLKTDVQENLAVREIRDHCKRLTGDGKIFQNYDGFVCFILSHGRSGGIYGVCGETISVEEIVFYFKENSDLLEKPKLFFIQACRTGDMEEDDGTEDSDVKKRLCPPGAGLNDDIAGTEFGDKRMMPIQVSTLTKFVFFKMATSAEMINAKHIHQNRYTHDQDDVGSSSNCSLM